MDTTQTMYDKIPGHTNYINIVRYGQHLLCDVLVVYAEQIVLDYVSQVKVMLKGEGDKKGVYGAVFGGKDPDGIDGVGQQVMLIKHAAPLAVHINTVLHLTDR